MTESLAGRTDPRKARAVRAEEGRKIIKFESAYGPERLVLFT